MKTFPVYVIFLLLMNISANYTGELFPCQIQSMLNSNIYLKHIIAWLTLLFFVVLDKLDSVNQTTFLDITRTTNIMYAAFIILNKCDFYFFLASSLLMSLCYLLRLQLIHLTSNSKTETSEQDIKNNKLLTRVLSGLLVVMMTFGFLLYMGAKKLEFKQRFEYLKFIFGKPVCTKTPMRVGYIKSLKAAFT